MPRVRLAALSILALLCAGCGDGEPTSTATTVPAPVPEGRTAYEVAGDVEVADVAPQDWSDLHNVFHLSDSIVSGSEPHSEDALRRISEMGVKTILSVDGKAPDVETAKKYGMTYVHVPIQYSGIPAPERKRIAKTFREMEGPFYVHCFHGKHRGPAAAALGRVVRDGAAREQAVAEMRHWCGTSRKYPGLYETVARATLPSAEETAAYDWDFPSAHRFEGFRQAMVEVSRPFDHLKALAQRGWEADPDHPDLHPANEAAKMVEVFAATAALGELQEKPDDFRAWLDESVEHARALDEAFRSLAAGDGEMEAVKQAYEGVAARCTTCHKAYRNE